jgi:succinate-acetate transporter protein
VSAGTSFSFQMALYAPINMVYAAFSAVMVYLTAYRNVALSLLHVVITISFTATVLARLDVISETLPGILHVLVGLGAFYYAVASLTRAFTGRTLLPLGPPLLHKAT